MTSGALHDETRGTPTPACIWRTKFGLFVAHWTKYQAASLFRLNRLIAMAGERFRCAGYTEISAVCTDAAHRGRGLASVHTRAVAARIRARGEEAFLHAAAANTNAIRLYQALGFTLRTTCDFAAVRPITDGRPPDGDPPALHGR